MDYQFPQSHISPEDVAEQLINPLERFIVEGAEEDPKEALRRFSQSRELIKQLISSISRCGHPNLGFCLKKFPLN